MVYYILGTCYVRTRKGTVCPEEETVAIFCSWLYYVCTYYVHVPTSNVFTGTLFPDLQFGRLYSVLLVPNQKGRQRQGSFHEYASFLLEM